MKRIISLAAVAAVLFLLARPAAAAYSCTQHTVKQAASGDHTTVTSNAIDTTALDTIIIGISDFPLGAAAASWITDSKSNSWGALSGASAVSSTNTRVRFYFCKSCANGTGHTFTYQSTAGSNVYPTITVLACSGGHPTAVTDQENGATTAGAGSLATGSITPTQDNELVVTVTAALDTGTLTTPTGYTLSDQAAYSPTVAIGGAMAYRIQTTATATNPSWTFSASVEASAGVASFKAAAGGGGATTAPCVKGLLGVGKCGDELR